MSVDGVRLAVLNHRLQGVARAMQNTLARTGRSGVLNTARDFSCCILTARDELLAAAESLPIHVMSGPDLTAARIRELHPDPARGDAFLHNSPYHGNSHAADHCLVVPVVDDGGVHRFSVLAKAHQADCGNALPTTYHAAARDVYEEGALLFDAVRVQRGYRDVDDVIRMCRLRIRVPEQWWGDYLAMLGAVRIGERRLLDLGAELGWEALEAYAGEWLDYSERRMEAALRRLPAGRVVAESAHDPFPGVPEGIPVRVAVEIDPGQGTVEVDLRDNPDCQPCGLNLTEATARTAAMIGVFNSIDHTVPPNAGSFRRLRIHLRENCCVGIPRHPASCSVATTNLADRVTSAIQRGIAELAEGAGMAECGPPIPASIAVLSGIDPRTGAPFVNQIFLALSGGAAAPTEDAWLSIGHVGNAGFVLRDSVEIDELHHPIRVVQQRLLPDTEGPGRFRGASSLLAEYGPIDGATLTVMYASDGTVNPARGARGGGDGALSRQFKRRRDGTLEEAPAAGAVVLEPGETIVSMSAGGGGYGPPRERDPDRVRRDVAEGWISAERAREVYGVTA
ncbi:MAG TPA: hydantoinase B/oxoprolinase family protein [Gaiellaceae bacterium]|nr:hydantoinase B/oxoprolinase family protein [Gaiellaceae bacterium]